MSSNKSNDVHDAHVQPKAFPVKARVTLQGLQAVEFNGKIGVVQRPLDAAGRQQVYVESLNRTVALKPSNLTLATSTLDDDLYDDSSLSELENGNGGTEEQQAQTEEAQTELEQQMPKEEVNPWRAISYVVFIVQFMCITLDFFVNTSGMPAFHYVITSFMCLTAMYLAGYEMARLRVLPGNGNYNTCKSYSSKAFFLVTLLCALQLALLGCLLYLLPIENDESNDDYIEYTMFFIGIVWSALNPVSYAAVATAHTKFQEQSAQSSSQSSSALSAIKKKKKKKKSKMSPFAAAWYVFAKIFTQTPFLYALGIVSAIGQAMLTTYQGAVINDITKAVTKTDPDTGELTATKQEIQNQAFILVAFWLAASLARFIFDTNAAIMFSKLEVQLRDKVFCRALQLRSNSTTTMSTKMSTADLQVRYTSDISGVTGLYTILLRGVAVNLILMATNFVFLAINQWQIAVVSIGYLVSGLNSGPTDLATQNSSQVQDDVTDGVALLGEDMDTEETGRVTTAQMDKMAETHRTAVLVPLQKDLAKRIFFSNMVDTFMFFYSSFLTAIVVIVMAWLVVEGKMNATDFLGFFYIFKQLQKPTMKISKVVKKAASKSANLSRIVDLLDDSQDTIKRLPSDVEANGDVEANE